MMPIARRTVLSFSLAFLLAPAIAAPAAKPYFPPAGAWEHKSPAALGIDKAKLDEAIAYASAHETERAKDFSDQQQTFGQPLGSLPTKRAATNGVVIYKGYVVAEFGDTNFVDPTYSVAKSMLSTVAGVAVRDGKIPDLNQPVGQLVQDGGYASPHNAAITWKHHLQQESEWEGSMWGKNADFIGREAFGAGERKPRQFGAPGSYYDYIHQKV
jgi:CubicO group peptidase (beta-lactamase class C family)